MAMKVRYTTVNGRVIAEKRNGVRSYYVADALGSTVALLDNTQSKTDTFIGIAHPIGASGVDLFHEAVVTADDRLIGWQRLDETVGMMRVTNAAQPARRAIIFGCSFVVVAIAIVYMQSWCDASYAMRSQLAVMAIN